MSDEPVKIHNKTDRPDNVVEKEKELFLESERMEGELPQWLRGFFIYLKGNVLPATRTAYLRDIHFFFQYLVDVSGLVTSKATAQVDLTEFRKIRAQDVNEFLNWCRQYKVTHGDSTYIYENGNYTLARKKASLSVMFKQLYRDEVLEKNITDGFNPIRIQKPSEHEVKALNDDEVMIMLDAVTTGEGLTAHEKSYWEKTKLRDKAILMLFLTYGLRLSELQQLNVSSFNFDRGEFKIYRKRGKESIMPLNRSAEEVVKEYIDEERLEDVMLDEHDRDALFLSLQNHRMTGRQIRTCVKKYTSIAMKTSRKTGYSPHKLRATAATSLIGRGNSIYDVAALLDHDQVTTTQLYARQKEHVRRDLVKDMEWETERKESEAYAKRSDDELTKY